MAQIVELNGVRPTIGHDVYLASGTLRVVGA
jgi:hypothetical protein